MNNTTHVLCTQCLAWDLKAAFKACRSTLIANTHCTCQGCMNLDKALAVPTSTRSVDRPKLKLGLAQNSV
jgi:hypothetical protein